MRTTVLATVLVIVLLVACLAVALAAHFCPQCRGEVPEEAKFCPNCGTPLGTQPTLPKAKVLYVGSDQDMARNEAVSGLLSAAGLDVDARPSLPAALAQYDVVVFDKAARDEVDNWEQQAAVAKALYGVAAAGRGVVLGGYASHSFGRQDDRMGTASQWVGCGEFMDDVFQGGSLLLARTRPFDLPFGVGTQVYRFAGDVPCFAAMPERLEPSAQAVIQLAGQAYRSGEGKWVGAYANVFGKGRVYWQGLTYQPNSRQVNELFVRGVRWAAHLIEIGGSVQQPSGGTGTLDIGFVRDPDDPWDKNDPVGATLYVDGEKRGDEGDVDGKPMTVERLSAGLHVVKIIPRLDSVIRAKLPLDITARIERIAFPGGQDLHYRATIRVTRTLLGAAIRVDHFAFVSQADR